MADQAQVLNSTMNDTASNKTLTGRAAATPEGLLLAYASLILMALLPIWFGAFKSVTFNKKQKVKFSFYIVLKIFALSSTYYWKTQIEIMSS